MRPSGKLEVLHITVVKRGASLKKNLELGTKVARNFEYTPRWGVHGKRKDSAGSQSEGENVVKAVQNLWEPLKASIQFKRQFRSG